jgi:hypothetical protein
MPEHAVIAHFPISGGAFGNEGEREKVHELEDELLEAIEDAGVGEFDGDEFGGNQCTLYMYGPDADKLFAIVEPILRASGLTKGGNIVRRYGDASDRDAREVRIDL